MHKKKNLFACIFLLVFVCFKFFFKKKSNTNYIYFNNCNDDNLSKIQIAKHNENLFRIITNEKMYYLNSQPIITCDLYKSLRRGPGQNVISFSLYGKSKRYYFLIDEIIQKIKSLYPGHTIRIYHDDSIDREVICEKEMKYSQIDFCNVQNISLSINVPSNAINFKYLHAMMWRFLPIGDTFVNSFMSRDLDSEILEREVDSVEDWKNSNNIGHIMRDNPHHGTEILGGMWGFKVEKARNLGSKIFEMLKNKKIMRNYNKNGKSPNGFDQKFLSEFVYNEIKNFSTIHDSFLCKFYTNSKPWPTQRKGNCFVGRSGRCNESAIYYKCPVECRRKDKTDWESC